MKYLKWSRGAGEWVGRTSCGVELFRIERRKGRPLLRRRSGAAELCRSVGEAKAYAEELARFSNFRPH